MIPAEVEAAGRAWLRAERALCQQHGYTAMLAAIRQKNQAERAFSRICSSYSLRYLIVAEELGDIHLRHYLKKEYQR